MAFRAGGGRRRQRFSAFMATFFLVSFLSFSKWKEKRQVGLWGPEAAVTEEEEEEAGARRSGPGLAGRRLRGKGRRKGRWEAAEPGTARWRRLAARSRAGSRCWAGAWRCAVCAGRARCGVAAMSGKN